MNRMTSAILTGGMLLMAALLSCCGGPQQVAKADPVALLAAGRYADARAAAEAGSGDPVLDRAVIALSRLAEDPTKPGAAQALDTLLAHGNAVAATATADRMLGLIGSLPKPAQDDVSMPAAEVALAAAGKGPLARSQSGPVPGSEVSRSLATSVLARLQIWLAESAAAPNPERLLRAWNGSYTLLGGSMDTGNPVQAWKLYTALAGLAVILDDTARDSDLTKVLLRSTVEVVEQNPEITIAVRCDLASPFDKLRAALTYDRDLLGRLERSVADAVGCSRGKYAPKGEG
jgi:hypothetical protein